MDIHLHTIHPRIRGDVGALVMVKPGSHRLAILEQHALNSSGQMDLECHTTLAVELIPH